MKKTLWIIVAIVIIILIAVFVGSNKTNADKIRIGYIGPLSGDVANIGQNNKAAIEIAVEEINAKGGIKGKPIEMIWEDGKCDGAPAVSAAQKLVNVDKVEAIIGGACSGETVAAAPVAEKGKVVLFSPLSSNPSITTAGDYIFRDYPSDSFQGVKAAEFITKTLGAKKVAVLSCQTDWCSGISKVFEDELKNIGSELVAKEEYAKDATDLRSQISKIKAANPEVVYFLGYTEGTIIGLKQMKSLGLNVKIVGGDAWNDPKIVQEAGVSAEGIMYLQPSTPANDSFAQKMFAKTGSKEIAVGSTQAYDALNILAQAIEKNGYNSSGIKSFLYKVNNYDGVSGKITIDKNGDLVGSKYDIFQVKSGKAVVIN